MSSPPNTPLSVANVALTEARVMRGEWLQLLASGSVTVTDLLVAAADGEGSPLRRLRLEQVLAAQEEWSIERARTVFDWGPTPKPGTRRPSPSAEKKKAAKP